MWQETEGRVSPKNKQCMCVCDLKIQLQTDGHTGINTCAAKKCILNYNQSIL